MDSKLSVRAGAHDSGLLASLRSDGTGLLTATALGLLAAGLFAWYLEFIGLDRAALDLIDPRLVPLIAHDRAGFGGGLATTGLTVLGCVWCGRPSRARWEALLIAGTAGFGAAVGVHGLIGYLDMSHVGPAILGAGLFVAGIVLSRPSSAARTAN